MGFLPLPVDPISKAMTRSLRSTGITPLQRYKETDSPPQLDSDDAAMAYERFIRCGSAKPVANYYGVGLTRFGVASAIQAMLAA